MAIKIMLDAGHYGKYNRSAVVPAYWESNMTWALHLKLKAELEKYGFDVQTTRSEQSKDLPVYERGRKAKGCDLFLSLHSNGANTETVDRVDVFYAFDNQNNAKDLAEKLANGIAELMEVSYGSAKTRESASYPGTEYYGVMRGARKVGVPLYFILEHSFHSNKKAAEWLLKEDNLQKLAVLEAGILASHYGLLTPTLAGDLNQNGKLDARDYLLLRRYLFGLAELTDEQKKAADFNGDGKVNALDYIGLRREILEK